jgi:hypothetical protein
VFLAEVLDETVPAIRDGRIDKNQIDVDVDRASGLREVLSKELGKTENP